MASKRDLFENKSVLSAVITLALPSIMGQIILVIYNMADTLFVGLTKSDEMLTAVTVCMPAFMFLSAISNLFGVGGASVISRAMGKDDELKARRTSAYAIWSCIAVTLLYCLGVFLLMDPFVNALGGKAEGVHGHAVQYMTAAVVLGGLPTSVNTLFSHLIRSRGNSTQASIGIAIGGVLNIALDPLFMFVILDEEHAALGAAIATALSNVIALIYYIVILILQKDKLSIRVRPSKGMFKEHIPYDVFIVGLPACLMTLCENISYAILDNLMAATGAIATAAQAGIGVAKKVNMLAHSFVRGMAQGVLPLIGYNYASGNRKRMKSVIFTSGAISIVLASLCLIANLTLSTQLTGIFIKTESDSLMYGAQFLRILTIGAPFSAAAYTIISFFQATGRGGKSLILALLRKGILDIPLMFILRTFIPVYGIVWATPIADILCCIVAITLFIIFINRHGQNKGIHKETAAA